MCSPSVAAADRSRVRTRARCTPGDDAYAVYLNDVTGAKMDTFLKVGIDDEVRACRADDLRDVTVAVTLTERRAGRRGLERSRCR